MCNCLLPDNAADGRGFMKQFRKTKDWLWFGLPACTRSPCPGRRGRGMRCSQVPPGLGAVGAPSLPPRGCFSPAEQGGGACPAGVEEAGGLVLAWPAWWSLVKTPRLLPPPPLQRKLDAKGRSVAGAFDVCVGLAGRGGAAPKPRFPSAPGRRSRLNSPGSGCHLTQLLEMKTWSPFAGVGGSVPARSLGQGPRLLFLPPGSSVAGRVPPRQPRSRQERPAPPNQ